MTNHRTSRSLLIISLVAIVNALGYGIIIPLQYAYISRFGLGPMWFGVLFASFSLAQFISTPIIGRLSDRFGRKPLLFYSVMGTAVSFLLFAVAKNPILLFVSRTLDGVSGGNISVAQAVISDLTQVKERAKWFGILGAAFGFGFIFGPALGGVLSTISLQAPFYAAAFISLVACILILFLFKESLPKKNTERKSIVKLFAPKQLIKALFEPYVGLVLINSFIAAFAFSVFILGFQAFTNDVLKLSPGQISLIFMLFGVIGLVMQGLGVGKLVKKYGEMKMLFFGVIVTGFSFFAMGLYSSLPLFLAASIGLAIGNSFLSPIIVTLLSKATRKEDQGGILGMNQSYVSLANIAGPIVGGILASYAVSVAFFGALVAIMVMFWMTMIIAREKGKHTLDL